MTAVLPELDTEQLSELQFPCEVRKPVVSEQAFLSGNAGRPCENPAEMLNLVVCASCNDPRYTLNCFDCTTRIGAGATRCRKCSFAYLTLLSSDPL